MPLAFSSRHMTKKSHKKLSERKYDLYFSGILQNWDNKEKQGDLRKKFKMNYFTVYLIFQFLRNTNIGLLIYTGNPFIRIV